MRRSSVPKALQESLGEDGTAAFVEVWNKQQTEMTDDIVRAVVRELEPRFLRIEARLDQCATKEDLRAFATKEDLRAFATKEDFRAFATKEDLARFPTKSDPGVFATKDDLRVFATQERLDHVEERFDRKFDLMLEKMERLSVEMAAGFGGMRAETAGVRADLMRWMFVFWVGQAFVVLAYFRAGQYLAAR